MWLLDCTKLDPQRRRSGNIELKFFHEKNTPPYAILSHTWIEDSNQEVSFREMKRGPDYSKLGCEKVLNCCLQTKRHGFNYCWIDTCCIDKDSSAELSEAINSMFVWYNQAVVCFAYLPTVDTSSPEAWAQFEQSRWFTRGWTLQELIAPSKIIFFGKDWRRFGTKKSLCNKISKVTGIHVTFLLGSEPIRNASIAARMSWAANRETTRTEDLAYCLLGIFGINMSLLYGERESAFVRLQEEIIKEFDDQSLFAWESSEYNGSHGIIARSPRDFANSADIYPNQNCFAGEPFTITNRGLKVKMPFIRSSIKGQFQGLLGCVAAGTEKEADVIALTFTSEQGTLEPHEQLKRVPNSMLTKVPWNSIDHNALDWATVFIAKTTRSSLPENPCVEYQNSFHVSLDDSQISGTCHIQGFFPQCCCDGQVGPPKGVWLNPLSKNSDHVVICIKQPSDTELFLVFGFKARLNGAVDAKKFWFGKFPWNMESTEIDCRLREKHRNGAPVTHAERLEVVWEMLGKEDMPWNTIVSGVEIEDSGYKIKVEIQPETSLQFVYQSVRIVYSPLYKRSIDYTPLKANPSKQPLNGFTGCALDEPPSDEWYSLPACQTQGYPSSPWSPEILPMGIGGIGPNHPFGIPHPIEFLLPSVADMDSATAIDNPTAPNNSETEVIPSSVQLTTVEDLEDITNCCIQAENVTQVENIDPALWVQQFALRQYHCAALDDTESRDSTGGDTSPAQGTSSQLDEAAEVEIVDRMGRDNILQVEARTSLISLRPRL